MTGLSLKDGSCASIYTITVDLNVEECLKLNAQAIEQQSSKA